MVASVLQFQVPQRLSGVAATNPLIHAVCTAQPHKISHLMLQSDELCLCGRQLHPDGCHSLTGHVQLLLLLAQHLIAVSQSHLRVWEVWRSSEPMNTLIGQRNLCRCPV